VMSIVVPRIRYLLIQFIMPLKRTSLQGSATFGRCHDLKATVCVESNGLRKPDPHTFEPNDTPTCNGIQGGPYHGIILLSIVRLLLIRHHAPSEAKHHADLGSIADLVYPLSN
jgi:hypothetical protein